MTATAGAVSPWYPEGQGTQLPPGAQVALQASSVVGQGQLATLDSSGNAALNDGTVPNLVAAGVGYPGKLSDSNTSAGIAKVLAWWGFGGIPFSTGSGDGFTAADVGGQPAFIATENTIGRKSNVSGSNRSFGGLVFGLLDDGLARFWGGPIGQLMGRTLHALTNESAGSYAYPVDAGATTDYAAAIPMARRKTHGVITSITITPSAALSATSGNDRTITIKKRDSLGVATAVSVGTFTTTTALVAFVPVSFTLTATVADLNMLETDYLSIENSHAASGAIVPASAIQCNMKVI